MKLKLVNGGPKGSEIDVSDATFGREFNEPLVHQVLTAYAAAGRSGTKAQLTKAEVRGAYVGKDNIRRLNLRFLDGPAPKHLVRIETTTPTTPTGVRTARTAS